MASNNIISQQTRKIRLHKDDCGSSMIQISSLSIEIDVLTDHLKKFKKDIHSKRGLIKKVTLRRRLLRYLKQKNQEQYQHIMQYLNIKK